MTEDARTERLALIQSEFLSGDFGDSGGDLYAIKAIKWMHEELRAALRREARLVEGLSFYANQDNWTVTPSDLTNEWAYTTIYNDSATCDTLIGGKRAREALAENQKERGGE